MRRSRTSCGHPRGSEGLQRRRAELHGHLPCSGRRGRTPVRRRFTRVRRSTISAYRRQSRRDSGGGGSVARRRPGEELDRHRRHRPRSPTAARASGTASNHPGRQRLSSSSTARNSTRLRTMRISQSAAGSIRTTRSSMSRRLSEPVRRPVGPEVRRSAAAISQSAAAPLPFGRRLARCARSADRLERLSPTSSSTWR